MDPRNALYQLKSYQLLQDCFKSTLTMSVAFILSAQFLYTYCNYTVSQKVGHRLMAITLSNLNRFKKNCERFLGKFVVKWILNIPPHLKYVARLPCNLSSMACFADINASQGSIATYARCDGICKSIKLQIYRGIFQ